MWFDNVFQVPFHYLSHCNWYELLGVRGTKERSLPEKAAGSIYIRDEKHDLCGGGKRAVYI